MGDDSTQKSEQPTPKKLRDAKEEGQVTVSHEITIIFTVIAGLVYMLLCSNKITGTFTNNYLVVFGAIHGLNLSFSMLIGSISKVFTDSFMMLLQLMLIMFITGLVIIILQIGGVVVKKDGIKFDFNHLNIVNNFKQQYSLKNLLKFVKELFEIAILLTLGFYLVKHYIPDLLLLSNYSLAYNIMYIAYVFIRIIIVLVAVFFVFALIDYLIEKISMLKQLMMSIKEVRDEEKETNGNPEIKRKRRELHQELQQEDGNVLEAMQNATLVLANPTHIAVVVQFSIKKCRIPVVIIKAQNNYAQIVFRIAKKNNIPIMRDIWLARKLYAIAEVGKFIPYSVMPQVADIFNKNITLFPKLMAEIEMLRQESAGKSNSLKI